MDINRAPPTDQPTVSSSAAAIKLDCFTSQVQGWIADGLLEGGALEIPGRTYKLWWASLADLELLVHEGGKQAGIAKRKRRLQES